MLTKAPARAEGSGYRAIDVAHATPGLDQVEDLRSRAALRQYLLALSKGMVWKEHTQPVDELNVKIELRASEVTAHGSNQIVTRRLIQAGEQSVPSD